MLKSANDSYFINADRPISEIFELLPQFKLSTDNKQAKFIGDPNLLEALDKHLIISTDIVIQGLQTMLELFVDNTKQEEFEISSCQWQDFLAFISLNINLVQSQREVQDNIICAKKLREQ